MSRFRWSLMPFATLLALGATGCAGRSSLEALHAQPPEDYRGHYTIGPDGSWFRPCGSAPADDAWWVTTTGTAARQAESARRSRQLVEGEPSFVHWRGVITRGGEVGPPGATALLVREIVTLRPAGPSDCGPS